MMSTPGPPFHTPSADSGLPDTLTVARFPCCVSRGRSARSTGFLRAFYRTKDEQILGHSPVYYPSIGWINFTQSLRIALFHDAHHFAAIREALAPGGGGHPHVA